MLSMGLGLWLGVVGPSWADDTVPPAYVRTVDLLQRRYLYPERATPEVLLQAAATGLERGLDWLYVDTQDGVVTLRHGTGRVIGTVQTTGWEDLAPALYGLERAVLSAGYSTGDVDLRLTLLAGLTTILDPFSTMLAGEKLDSFDTRLKGTMIGVGFTLRPVEDRLTVVDVLPQGPAGRAGVLVGDVLERIDGASTLNLPVREATRRIRGIAGSTVQLALSRGGAPVDVTLTREAIVLPNVAWDVLDGGVGLVRIDNISQQTLSNLRGAFAELRALGALDRGLLLDLRGNTGGSMRESAGVVDLFVTGGSVLTTVGVGGAPVADLLHHLSAHPDGDELDIPLVVLVDRRTASGAEIIAGSLQELGRAVVVGQRTFGKGLVQQVYPLDHALSFKLTIAEYVLAHERHVAGTGIRPDLTVGRIDIGRNLVRYEGFDEAREGVPFSEIVPAVHVDGTRAVDTLRELGRLAILSTSSAKRADVLDAVRRAADLQRLAADAELVAAYAARGLDWSTAPSSDGPLATSATALAVPDPQHPERRQLTVTVRNPGSEPMHRALVRVACPSFDLWDGLVIPVGLVAGGGSASATIPIVVPAGLRERADRITLHVRAEGHAETLAGDTVLIAGGVPDPHLRVTSRLEPASTLWRAVIELTNRSDVPLDPAELSFIAPDVEDVELVEGAARIPGLEPWASASVVLTLRRGPAAPDEIPVQFVVETDARGAMIRRQLPLHISGRSVSREAPIVTPGRYALTAPVGRFSLPLDISDDVEVDSITVFLNDDKILWHDGESSRVRLTPTFELRPGPNVVHVVAADDTGIRTNRIFRVYGLPSDGQADAGDDPSRKKGRRD